MTRTPLPPDSPEQQDPFLILRHYRTLAKTHRYRLIRQQKRQQTSHRRKSSLPRTNSLPARPINHYFPDQPWDVFSENWSHADSESSQLFIAKEEAKPSVGGSEGKLTEECHSRDTLTDNKPTEGKSEHKLYLFANSFMAVEFRL